MCVYYIRKHTAHISTVINPKFTHQYYIYIFIGINVNLGSYEDPHAIAGALKLYFRELPIPLIPFDSFDDPVLHLSLHYFQLDPWVVP